MKNQFKTNLLKLRNANSLTQEQLATQLKISRSNIGAYEEGRARPDYDRLIKIADFFGVTVHEIIAVKLKKNVLPIKGK